MSDGDEKHNGDDDWLAQQGFDLSALTRDESVGTPEPALTPDLPTFDRALVAFSGGKDSLALLLHLIDLGFPRSKIELHHHLVDGREGSTLMDWPCTEGYCVAIARAFGVDITFSWRSGGLEAEMLRDGTPTAPVSIPSPDGGYVLIGGKGPLGTRRKFPQVSADLSVRWCSSANKISCMDAYIRNHPKFLNSRTLVLTGERAEESTARSKYAEFEPHRSDTRNSKRVPRHVDVWRAVHSWSERQVWDLIQRYRVCPHAAYWLGWTRTSCRQCVFGNPDQWASARAIAPEQFGQIARYEREFGITIHRKLTVTERADAGTPYGFDPKWVEIANHHGEFMHPVFMDNWMLPKGAFGEGCGPT